VIPVDSPGPVEYEGEIVAVVGKKAKHLSERDALGCIAGYTLGNDVSERAWQQSDRTLWRAKSIDTFKPMGPS
jgi:2-keto-4-pentenoate hydratase/2-oxohepta-3-ene-1,7-dioic acid hydratase in catechol pathway